MLEFFFGRLAKRWRWLRTLLDIQQRFGEIKGGYLASAVTLNLFVSVFPLLLVAIAAVGFVSNNNVEFVQNLISDLVPEQALVDRVNRILDAAVQSRRSASIIGFVLLLWSGLGVASVIGYASDTAWQLSGRGIIDRLPGLVWGIGALLILTSSIAVTSAVDYFAAGALFQALSILLGFIINTLFFLWTFMVLTSKRLPYGAHLPGAIVGGVGLELLKQVVTLIPSALSQPAAIWGSIGAVFAVIATLAVFSRLMVYGCAYNVVRWEKRFGTMTLEIEVPKLPGVSAVEANRNGAIAGSPPEEAEADGSQKSDSSKPA